MAAATAVTAVTAVANTKLCYRVSIALGEQDVTKKIKGSVAGPGARKIELTHTTAPPTTPEELRKLTAIGAMTSGNLIDGSVVSFSTLARNALTSPLEQKSTPGSHMITTKNGTSYDLGGPLVVGDDGTLYGKGAVVMSGLTPEMVTEVFSIRAAEGITTPISINGIVYH